MVTNCFCHQWTFEAVPSARTSEYGNQPSFAKFSHGTQYLFQTVWCMGIVAKYRNVIFAHTNFGSARHTRAAAYCLHTLCKGKSTAHKHADCCHQIIYRKLPGKPQYCVFPLIVINKITFTAICK